MPESLEINLVPTPDQPHHEPVKLMDGVKLCKILHAELAEHGYFPALTGGLLYKNGERKDCDIVIYRHRQKVDHFEMFDIEQLLLNAGLSDLRYFGFVTKASFGNMSVDLFNPESVAGEMYAEH